MMVMQKFARAITLVDLLFSELPGNKATKA